MLITKIVNKILGRDLHIRQLKHLEELGWANIYHDSIRGKQAIENLPINFGRYAGNYAFFYVLNRILSECRPNSILEFGLGESSKFISTYVEFYLEGTKHDIIEQDADWMRNLSSRFSFSSRSKIHISPVVENNIKGFLSKGYKDIIKFQESKYEFYVIDGPFGSPRYSRYDIVFIAQLFKENDEFVILLDDYNRVGEKDTFQELKKTFIINKIKVHIGIYEGLKSVAVIATKKYKFMSSL